MDRVSMDIASAAEQQERFAFLRSSAILVTGATGLIGSMLVKTLDAANKKHRLNMTVIGQIRNIEKASAVFGGTERSIILTTDKDVPCDYIVHTVSPTKSRYFIENPVETIKVSVQGTIDFLELAKKHSASAVYLSSMEQYGIPYVPGARMTEDEIGRIDHLNVRSSYSESKRLCECLCASYSSEYGVNVKIARLAQTFGAGVSSADNRMPVQFARAAAAKEDIILHTEGRSVSNYVYLTDAIAGILKILEKGESGQAYNVCNDRETRSVREIADLVAANIANGEINVRTEIPAENMGYAPDVNLYLDSSKLRRLGWTPEVNMVEGYGRLVQYLIECT